MSVIKVPFRQHRSRLAFFLALISTGVLFQACSTQPVKEKKELTQTERARLLVEVANGALSEGDPTSALMSLSKAEEIDGALPELHHSKSLAFYAKRDLRSAEAEAKRAVELNPVYADANNTLGKILLDLGRLDEAVTPLQQAASNPIYREAYKANTNLGILYYRKSAFNKASEFFEKAAQEYPLGACIAYYYRGHLQLQKGNSGDAAREYLRASQKACAGFVDAHLALGIAYERGKQFDLARKTFLGIKQNFPESKVAEQAMNRLRNLP